MSLSLQAGLSIGEILHYSGKVRLIAGLFQPWPAAIFAPI